MSYKKKTDMLKIFCYAMLSMAVVMSVYLLRLPRFSGIVPVIVTGVVIAFVAEILILMVLKGRNVLKRTIKIILLFVVNVSVFFGVIVYSFAPAVILQPHSDEQSYEALQNVSQAEEITFEGANGKINGWFYNIAGERAPVVLYFYGNYETASTRLLQLTQNYTDSAFDGCNFAVFDYPAYGNSDGKCTDNTIQEFATDVYDELIKRTDNIIVLGYSVGTGPACYLAGNREVRGLILYAPYNHSLDLYNNIIDVFHGPAEFLVSFRIDNTHNLKNNNAPVLILASRNDELIPFSSSEYLYENFSDLSVFVEVSGITHNQFLSDSFVRAETSDFIREVTAE